MAPTKTKKKKSASGIVEITPVELRKMINKEFGAGTAMLGSDPSLRITRIPTGILAVDMHMGGGLPRGRSVEVFGAASVGKSVLAAKVMAQAQKMGLLAGYVDCERSFDPEFATHVGVDVDALDYHRQKSGEECVAYMEFLLYGGHHGVVVLDSIASLLPKQEKEATLETGSMGMEQAKLMSKALRKLTTANDKTVLIFINQLREAVGVKFGKKTTTSGGRAMGFYASTRIELVKVETMKKPGKALNAKTGEISTQQIPYAHRVLLQIAKDKTGGSRPLSETSFVFNYETADVDHIEDLIYVGRASSLIKKSKNNWWLVGYEDEKQNGRPKFVKWLKKNRVIREEFEEQIQGMILTAGQPRSDDD